MCAQRFQKLWLQAALILFLWLPFQVFGAENIELQLVPENKKLRSNIEAYLGKVSAQNELALRRYARFARGEIEKALKALGYYNYQINLEVIEGDTPRLQAEVISGRPVRLAEVSIRLLGEASEQADFKRPAQEQLRSGQPLNHGQYEAVKQQLRNQALSFGYFKAEFIRQEIVIDTEAETADIWLHFDSGPRYHLGEISFDHEGIMDAAFLQKFVHFAPGQAYSNRQLTELSRKLRASGYFSQVLVNPRVEKATPDLQVPIEVRVRNREPRTLNLGLGFSTDIGPRISAGWVQHWVNPQGLRRGADIELSQPRQTLSGWYEFPLTPPTTDKLRFSSRATLEDLDDQKSRRYGAAVQWFHRQDNEWDRVLSLRGERETYQVGSDDDATWLLLPGIGYGRLKTDRDLDPTEGFRLQFDLEGSRENLLADTDILQLTVLARGLTTWRDNHRFLARFRGGATATNNFSRVPASLRFFAGGDQSVRGYGYQKLAPRDQDGQLLGGRYLASVNLEYQYILTKNWRWAFFIDAGDAVSQPEALKTPKRSAGTGLRWVSPLGPLRVDIAKGLDPLLGGWRLHLSLGPEL